MINEKHHINLNRQTRKFCQIKNKFMPRNHPSKRQLTVQEISELKKGEFDLLINMEDEIVKKKYEGFHEGIAYYRDEISNKNKCKETLEIQDLDEFELKIHDQKK